MNLRNCILSYDPADKLQAVMASDLASADKPLPARYLEACRLWYDDFTDTDRLLAQRARAAYLAGAIDAAEALVSNLPACPPAPEELTAPPIAQGQQPHAS
jgi:hypothetical protein